MSGRLQRALNQRLLILSENISEKSCQYEILGSTQSIYQVKISPDQYVCTCPDFQRRSGGSRLFCCKHIYFVLIKILNYTHDNSENNEDDEEFQLDDLEMRCKKRLESLQSSLTVVSVDRRPMDVNSECPICLELITKDEETSWCKSQCGGNVHSVCIQRWLKVKGGNHCPLCRAPWKAE
jgi:hypothetical protein